MFNCDQSLSEVLLASETQAINPSHVDLGCHTYTYFTCGVSFAQFALSEETSSFCLFEYVCAKNQQCSVMVKPKSVTKQNLNEIDDGLKGKYRPFSFGRRTHPFGRRTHPFGRRTHPFGRRTHPFGRRTHPFGRRTHPFGRRTHPIESSILRLTRAVKTASVASTPQNVSGLAVGQGNHARIFVDLRLCGDRSACRVLTPPSAPDATVLTSLLACS